MVELGLSALRFRYAEYRDDGHILDQEQGIIPGMSFAMSKTSSAWRWSAAASYHAGRADYSGQTNLGVPLDSKTDERIGDVMFQLGYRVTAPVALVPYAGMGYRRWDRDILPVGNVSGLFESYRWKYLLIGAKLNVLRRATTDMWLDLGWIGGFDREVRVPRYSVTVKPDQVEGFRATLSSTVKFGTSSVLVFEPYWEYWHLGRSNTVTAGTTTLYEPTSRSRNAGLRVRLGTAFK